MNILAKLRAFWWHDTVDAMQAKMLREIPPREILRNRRWLRNLSKPMFVPSLLDLEPIPVLQPRDKVLR